MQDYTFHSATEAFPIYPYYFELRAQVKGGRGIDPIKILNGQIIDGRTRYKICADLNIEPEVVQVEGNPFELVWQYNRDRFDIGTVQRYLIWWYCYEMADQWHKEQQEKRGEKFIFPRENRIQPRRKSRQVSIEDCAKYAGVPISAVHRGDRLLRYASDLVDLVRLGNISPAKATRRIRKGMRERKEYIRQHDPDLAELVELNQMSLTEALRRVNKR